jgi:hypothetical protein
LYGIGRLVRIARYLRLEFHGKHQCDNNLYIELQRLRRISNPERDGDGDRHAPVHDACRRFLYRNERCAGS